MFDYFQFSGTGEPRCQAHELWSGAFRDPRVAALLDELGRLCQVDLSYRDGSWRTIGALVAAATD
jgi:hypothetical protein